MAKGDSLSGDRVTIWFAPSGSIGSELDTKGQKYQSFISNFDESGGEKDTEQVSVFSDTGVSGAVTRRKPREEKELIFDVVMRFDSKLTDFSDIENGNKISPLDNYESDFKVGMIAIQVEDGDGNYYWKAYNNVNAINFDTEFSAEEEWQGKLNFKLSPADPNGIKNIQDTQNITSDISTGLTTWN